MHENVTKHYVIFFGIIRDDVIDYDIVLYETCLEMLFLQVQRLDSNSQKDSFTFRPNLKISRASV